MTGFKCYRCGSEVSTRGECACSDSICLIHADCREVLPKLESGCVDLVLTDPPYGIGFRGEGWDEELPSWWLGLARRMSDRIVFTTAPLTLWDYPRPSWVNCWARPAAQSRAVSGGFNHWSPVVVYGEIKFPVDTISLHAMQHAKESGFLHPSPKPDALMRWLASNASMDGETICDPFAGSGTTGRAAKDLGRKCILIERELKYVQIAAQRLRQEVLTFTE